MLAGRWSSGHTKRVLGAIGCFMLRLGRGAEGNIASGEATTEGRLENIGTVVLKNNYVDFKFNKFLDYNEEIL